MNENLMVVLACGLAFLILVLGGVVHDAFTAAVFGVVIALAFPVYAAARRYKIYRYKP